MAGSQFGGRGPMPPTFGGAGGGIEQSLNGGGVNPNVIVVDTNSLTTRLAFVIYVFLFSILA
jgi:hypothetical protein